MAFVGLTQPPVLPAQAQFIPPYELLAPCADQAAASGAIEDASWAKEQWISALMGQLTPSPQATQAAFSSLLAQDPAAATEYLFQAQGAAGYIRTERMALNRAWQCATDWGTMTITVNLSKPEKDPASIAAAAKAPQLDYPRCAICKENEGFPGTASAAPRHCLRLIPLTLDGEEWYLQFSPYGYYEEHAIVLSPEHRPMNTEDATFRRLLDFCDLMPHYFIGSNADIPLVGGSILSHDHYQCGKATFPMERASSLWDFELDGLACSWLRWPLTTLRLRGKDKQAVARLAAKINDRWSTYDDPLAGIVSEREGQRHNALTSMARKEEGFYRLDLTLRNNRTTEDYPDGLFCPKKEVHAVKRENIGLIEVMGLAILPPRVLTLMEESLGALAGDKTLQKALSEAWPAWYDKVKNLSATEDALREAVGQTFALGLEQCCTLPSREAVRRFVEAI